MFAPYISRIGYDDKGQSWSIICPQQGIWISGIGCLNVEVTVTSQRGWVNETAKELAAEIIVAPRIWFNPSANQNLGVRVLWELFSNSNLPFPSSKAKAFLVNTYKYQSSPDNILPIRSGESPRFKGPEFARHPKHMLLQMWKWRSACSKQPIMISLMNSTS
jgi:hypothetical protein